ncbi:MAG: histidine kinase [Propionibacteriaceae bacterium]|nr:histidine kinase [Propionibacteriaceae bacterium]
MQVIRPFRVEGATRNEWFLDTSLAVTGIVLVHIPFLVALILMVPGMCMDNVLIAGGFGVAVFLSSILRHHYPGLFFLTGLLFVILQIIFLTYPTVSWIVMPLAMYDVARWIPSKRARIYLILALIVAFIEPVRWIAAHLFGDSDLRTMVILVGLSAAGVVTTAYSIGRSRHEVEAARARQVFAEKDAAALQIAEQAARQGSLEAQIRASIARELHDVVAHSISVMVVQAEGGLAQANRSPDTAQQVLTTISETGHEAMQEMRRIVRTLRADTDTNVDIASAPRLADLPLLVEKSQATLTVSGTPHGSTPIIEMTVYRVIQEALTNSLKHAGPEADPHVSVVWYPAYILVTITNRMTTPSRGGDNAGVGLIGMAERVQALDGTLTVGPTETGGFRVCAQIPLQTERLG